MYLYAYCFLLNFPAYRCIPFTYLCTYCLIVYSYLHEISRSQGSECEDDRQPYGIQCRVVSLNHRQDDGGRMHFWNISLFRDYTAPCPEGCRVMQCIYDMRSAGRDTNRELQCRPPQRGTFRPFHCSMKLPVQTSVCVGISSLFSHSMQLLGWATTASFHVPPSSQNIVELHKSLGQIILYLDMPILR
jgi:hypothetical protein